MKLGKLYKSFLLSLDRVIQSVDALQDLDCSSDEMLQDFDEFIGRINKRFKKMKFKDDDIHLIMMLSGREKVTATVDRFRKIKKQDDQG